MVAAKKTKPRKRGKKPAEPGKFTWTPKRKLAAKLLSEGTKNYTEVSKAAGINRDTLLEWRKHEEFLEKVDELTLKNELATRAGLLRECLLGLDKKKNYIESDKNTHLHYVQAIADLQGLLKQKVELEGNMNYTGEAVHIYIPDNGRDKKQDGGKENEDEA